jgi:hypothetical protein
LSTTTFLERAGRWFLHSGIQEPDGGVARYRRTDTGANLPVSNEITGYAVSTLAWLHARTRGAVYLERMLSAARFLSLRAWDEALQSFPFEPAAPGNGFTYFFDAGIIIRGLLAGWRISGDAALLETAAAAGRAMAADFRTGSCFHPILRLPDKRPVACDHRWSRSSGCYQLKSAMAWFDLHEQTGETRFSDFYREALEFSLRTHADFLPGDADPNRVMDRLHAYCYFLEGLLPVIDESQAAQALRAGMLRVAGFLREIGPGFERSDVYAQLLRVRLFADCAGVTPLDREAAAWEAERLAGFQSDDSAPQLAGGFWFGRKGAETLPFINPVSTAFGAQALAMWHDYLNGGAPPERHSLI